MGTVIELETSVSNLLALTYVSVESPTENQTVLASVPAAQDRNDDVRTDDKTEPAENSIELNKIQEKLPQVQHELDLNNKESEKQALRMKEKYALIFTLNKV